MAAPKIYRHTDPGAPQLSASMTTPTQLFELLKAVLVTGYGDKLGAGWTLVHETARAVWFRNASGAGNVGFYHMPGGSGYDYRIYLIESIDPNPTGDIPAGSNRRSGRFSLAYTSTAQWQTFMLYMNGVAGGCVWTVAADSDTMILTATGKKLVQTSSTNSWPNQLRLALYVGNTVGGRFISLGGVATNGNYPGYCPFGGCYVSAATTSGPPSAATLRDPITGLVPPDSAPAPVLDWYGQYSSSVPNGPAGNSWYRSGLRVPTEVALEWPELNYGGNPTGDRMKGVAIPRGLESLHFQYSYKFLQGSELTDVDQMLSPAEHLVYGQIIPFGGDEWVSSTFWLMLDPAWWG